MLSAHQPNRGEFTERFICPLFLLAESIQN